MWEGFVEQNHIHFNRDRSICSRFTLVDISGTEIEICGYADVEMTTLGDDEGFKQTRILIVAGPETSVILGRADMKILWILGENFPLRMQQISSNMERQARAKTLIRLEEEGNEDGDAVEEGTEVKEKANEAVQEAVTDE